MPKLPFQISYRLMSQTSAAFLAIADGKPVTSEIYRPGCGNRRRAIARLWAADKRLQNGSVVAPEDVAAELERQEIEAFHEVDRIGDQAETVATKVESKADAKVKASQATRLVELAAGCELFHDADDEAFATIRIDGHRETWPLRIKRYKQWLSRQFYLSEGKAPGSQAVQDALTVLGGHAAFEGPEIQTFVRVAEHNGYIYIDLCDNHWRAIEVTPKGWSIVRNPPVKFRRPKGMSTLPEPERGGSIDELRRHVNVVDDADFVLLVAFLVQALRPRGPYPVLVLNGEQGAAKSTTGRMIRALIDPSISPLRTEPRDDRDLIIAASNSWMIGLDNLSRIPGWLSDCICRLSTGGGLSTRQLYSDREETIFESKRPCLINGIEQMIERSDLIDRRIGLTLPTIPPHRRRTEAEVWQDFDRNRPRILGALLDAVSTALRNVDTVELATKPRMADFAVWIVAAEPALPWKQGEFLAAYTSNRDDANEIALEASPLAGVLRTWIGQVGPWEGTATELLDVLTEEAGKIASRKGWPAKPNSLSGILRRITPNLRVVGIAVELGLPGKRNGPKHIRIETVAGDENDHADDRLVEGSSSEMPPNDPENAVADDEDDANDHLCTQSKTAPHVRATTIPDGWSKSSWAQELERKATACEVPRPDIAAEYRAQVKAIRGETA